MIQLGSAERDLIELMMIQLLAEHELSSTLIVTSISRTS